MSWGGEQGPKIKVNPRVIGVTTGETREIGGKRYKVVNLFDETSETHKWDARTPHQISQVSHRRNIPSGKQPLNGFTGKR